MLAAEACALATELMDCRSRALLIAQPTSRIPGFDLRAGYDVLDELSRRRQAQGAHTIGRKIGFTNRNIWPTYGVSFPIWAPIWSDTVRFVDDNAAIVALAPFAQPRIEPEVVFRLAQTLPAGAGDVDVMRAIEWFAPGFEIVQCHFHDWRFSAADCVADFGLHGALVIGTPVCPEGVELGRHLRALASFDVLLYQESVLVDRGGGDLVLGSPVRALAHLANELEHAGRPPLKAGEIVTTGTLTGAWPVAPGESWMADYTTLHTAPLRIELR
jgi:2-oxo-3-hexenedioate decarboxylase